MNRYAASDSDEEASDFPLPCWLEGDSLAPPCQADMDVVRAIIDFADVTADDVLYDLGCGDGRICIEAAEKRGARVCGVEIEEGLVDKFRRRVAAKALQSKVSVVHGDLREVDLSDATVVVTYLLPEAMKELAESHFLPLLRRGSHHQHEESPSDELHDRRKDHGRMGVLRSRHSAQDFIEAGQAGAEQGGGSMQNVQDAMVLTKARTTAMATTQRHPCSHSCDCCKDVIVSKPCRIVCNTWGIPGTTAVKEAQVGQYGGVKLRLFTHESLVRAAGS